VLVYVVVYVRPAITATMNVVVDENVEPAEIRVVGPRTPAWVAGVVVHPRENSGAAAVGEERGKGQGALVFV
jgi:hypothetical protein